MTVVPNLADKALDAFWQIVVDQFPWATSGDLSPGATVALSMAARDAIDEWVANNAATRVGDVAIGYRFQLFRPVDRFPDFLVPSGRTGEVTAVDDSGVWARLDQSIAGAGHWDSQVHWQTIDEFVCHTIPA